MRSLLTSCLFGLSLLTCLLPVAMAGPIAPNDENIAYMGRVLPDATKAVLAYPGIVLKFVYEGPAPTLLFEASNGDNDFNLSCNGWEPVLIRLQPGSNRIALPTGIAPAGGWTIELVRRTESWMGTCQFKGLELSPGTRLHPPPPWPQRKLLFLGDSITCGEYIERLPPEDNKTARATNASRSYAMLLARWLNAQCHLVAYGGQGIVRDWAGREDSPLVPRIFERAIPENPDSCWDHSRYMPDVVVVNVGTDYDAGLPNQEHLAQAYGQFVGRIRSVHPDSFIVLCESSFQSDGSDGRRTTERDLLREILERIVRERKAHGDERIKIAAARFYPGTPSDGHLVAFQQEQLALELLAAVRSAAGW